MVWETNGSVPQNLKGLLHLLEAAQFAVVTDSPDRTTGQHQLHVRIIRVTAGHVEEILPVTPNSVGRQALFVRRQTRT